MSVGYGQLSRIK